MLTKKNVFLLVTTALVLVGITIFALFNWDVIVTLFTHMTTGVDIVKEYVESLGIIGVLSISLIIIVCFFFPVISSVPIQLTSAVTYGLPLATLHVLISIFIASQLVFLFTKTLKIFSTKKQIEERKALEEKIKNSKRSILTFIILAYLAPFIPFMLIHTVAANSGLKWWKYALITLIGPIPDIIVTLWAGVKITSSNPVLSYILLVVIIACVVLSIVFKNKIVDLIFTPKKEKTKERVDEQ